MSWKFYYSSALLMGALLLLARPAARAQDGQPGAVEKYRLQKNADPERAEQWAFCAAIAYAREHYSAEEFRERARNLVASLKQVVADSSVCPCEDAMPLSLWYGKTVPPRAVAGRPVLRPVGQPTGLPQVQVPLVAGLRAPRTPAPVLPPPPPLDQPAPGAAGPSAPGLPAPKVPRAPVTPSLPATAKTQTRGAASKTPPGGGTAARGGSGKPNEKAPLPRPTGGGSGAGSGMAQGLAGPVVRKSVQAMPIPNFSGQSGVLGDGLWGTRQGVYVAFIPNINPMQLTEQMGDVNNLKLPGTHVYKLHNRGWTQSVQERPLVSFFPLSSLNEGVTELSYRWAGPMTPKEMNRLLQNINEPLASASMYGLYSLNNDLPALDDIPPALFMKLASDRGQQRHEWAIGPPPAGSANELEVGASTLYISANKVSADRRNQFDHYDLSSVLPALGGGPLHLVTTDLTDNVHAWIGTGQTLVQAELDGSFQPIDLVAHGARGSISKMRCKQEVLWVLCGADLFRVANKQVRMFYTIRAAQPSFAIDNNYIFANDGTRISLGLEQQASFTGDAGTLDTLPADYDYLKTHLGSCQLECTDDPTERYLFALDATQGVVYRIEK